MMPSYPEFERRLKKEAMVPVFMETLADTTTPLSLFQPAAKGSRYSFLLESVEGGERLGRYSFFGIEPREIIEYKNLQIQIKDAKGRVRETHPCRDPLDFLKTRIHPIKIPAAPGLPRFFGGAVGYVGYDVIRTFERLPERLPDRLGLPEMLFMLTDTLVVFDHVSHTYKVIHCARRQKGAAPRAQYLAAENRIREMLEKLKPSKSHPPHRAGRVHSRDGLASSPKAPVFVQAILKAKEYIRKGDIIQVVLSRIFERPTKAGALDIYRSLRYINPSPYMYLLQFGDHSLVGTSPELLVRLEEGIASTRPIAGTRPRAGSPQGDDKLAKNLASDPKERAEHLMLVDLGRNDLGRVCVPGSVKTPTFMSIEKYSHVMHLVSEVIGRLDSKSDAFDLFKACFPAGTVTGAPKIRAMEIIDELETQKRGSYAGAVGYFGSSGNMDMAITIRTILLKGGRARIQAGAGIVADSHPHRELTEIQNKAAAMLKALEMAERNSL